MPQLFKGPLTHPTTKYIAVPVAPGGRLFLDIQWKDATSSAAITLETTGTDAADAAVDVAGAAYQWKTESGVAITGPAGAAAGSTKVHVSNLVCRRARLKIVTAAACDFEIYSESN